MDHNQLPDYIRNRQGSAPSLAHKAIGVVGAGAGPYLSIMGDRFTFVDIAGNEQPVQTLYVDVVIVDANEHMSKMYYATKYDPNVPSRPTCFSDNGVAPSVSASEPQARTCQPDPTGTFGCKWAVWGSKISDMGSKVPACRDEHKLAIIVPGMPNSMFRLTVPPNSLTNWRAYVAKFLNAGFDISDVVTRLSFEGGGERGTLQFAPSPQRWLDAATLAVRDQAVKTRASDMIVGRLDRPRQAAIAPPAALPHIEYVPGAPGHTVPPSTPFPAAAQAATPFPVQNAAFPSTQAAPAQTQTVPPAQAASPSDPPARRRRRTKQEMEQANAQQQPAAAALAAPAPAMAPFRPAANSGPAFGMQEAPSPNAELAANIESIFGR